MSLDVNYAEKNRNSSARLRALVAGLSDIDMLHPVGKH